MGVADECAVSISMYYIVYVYIMCVNSSFHPTLLWSVKILINRIQAESVKQTLITIMPRTCCCHYDVCTWYFTDYHGSVLF